MAYSPSSDFVGLWRAISGGVEKAEMPGLDFVAAALARAGIINVVTSQTAPITNQSTTAWFKPAVPSYASEGMLFFWDAGSATYVPATPQLFYTMISSGGTSGGGGIGEAPNDGILYGRQSLGWSPVPSASGVFVSTNPPSSPATGALWWNGSVMQLWEGLAWKIVGPTNPAVSPTQPTTPTLGEEWWNGTTLQVWDGSTWKAVGPPLGPTGTPLQTTELVLAISQGSDMTLGANTWGILPIPGTPSIDSATGWDTSTKKYTPKKAGYYAFSVRLYTSSLGLEAAVLKNDNGSFNIGSPVDTLISLQSTNGGWLSIACFAQMNGTTDFVRIFGASVSGTFQSPGGSPCFTALRMP